MTNILKDCAKPNAATGDMFAFDERRAEGDSTSVLLKMARRGWFVRVGRNGPLLIRTRCCGRRALDPTWVLAGSNGEQ
jgi:hypothetical protein